MAAIIDYDKLIEMLSLFETFVMYQNERLGITTKNTISFCNGYLAKEEAYKMAIPAKVWGTLDTVSWKKDGYWKGDYRQKSL